MAHVSQDKHFGPLGSCFAALTPCFEHVVAHKKYLQTKCGKLGEKKKKKGDRHKGWANTLALKYTQICTKVVKKSE